MMTRKRKAATSGISNDNTKGKRNKEDDVLASTGKNTKDVEEDEIEEDVVVLKLLGEMVSGDDENRDSSLCFVHLDGNASIMYDVRTCASSIIV